MAMYFLKVKVIQDDEKYGSFDCVVSGCGGEGYFKFHQSAGGCLKCNANYYSVTKSVDLSVVSNAKYPRTRHMQMQIETDD